MGSFKAIILMSLLSILIKDTNTPCAEQLIDNFEEKKNLVFVKYTYYDNPEQFTLDQIDQQLELHHINEYLYRHHRNSSEEITLVLMFHEGFLKINGESMYTYIATYEQFLWLDTCTDKKEIDYSKNVRPRTYNECIIPDFFLQWRDSGKLYIADVSTMQQRVVHPFVHVYGS